MMKREKTDEATQGHRTPAPAAADHAPRRAQHRSALWPRAGLGAGRGSGARGARAVRGGELPVLRRAPGEALAAIRATHRHELLGRHARRCRARLPDRLEAIEPIDAVRVEARDPPPQALEFGGLASLHRSSLASSLRGGVANCDAAL